MSKALEKTPKIDKPYLQIIDMAFYTVLDAAQKTGFTERYIREVINNGLLKAFKTGRKWFILHTELIEFIKSENDKD